MKKKTFEKHSSFRAESLRFLSLGVSVDFLEEAEIGSMLVSLSSSQLLELFSAKQNQAYFSPNRANLPLNRGPTPSPAISPAHGHGYLLAS